MTHKHTAGPWHVDKGYGLYGCVYGDGKLVANCEPEIHKETHTMNEISANAHLIAAAPELLEALRVMVDHASEKYPHFESERGQADIKAALDAIAKAEGKQ